jgi:ubiquinone/menaquinone biosynthesis C-methylase UbiE
MRLGQIEKLAMNNPIRAWVQEHVEAARMLDLGGPAHGRVLEIGCGRGEGARLALDVLGAETVDAFDLDPDMVRRARARLAERGDRVRLWTGSVTSIEAEDCTYDAVIDFGILHHVADWRLGLREVLRVLKPGGTFYAEEVFLHAIDGPIARLFFVHPARQHLFDHDSFHGALTDLGFEVFGVRRVGRLGGWYVARRS